MWPIYSSPPSPLFLTYSKVPQIIMLFLLLLTRIYRGFFVMPRNEKRVAEHSGIRIKIPSNSLDLIAMCREEGQYRYPLPTIDCHKKHGRCRPPPQNSKNIPLEVGEGSLIFIRPCLEFLSFYWVGTILILKWQLCRCVYLVGDGREKKTFLREGGVCHSQKKYTFTFVSPSRGQKKVRWRNSSSSIMDDNFLFVSPNTKVDFPIISAWTREPRIWIWRNIHAFLFGAPVGARGEKWDIISFLSAIRD